MPDPAGDPEGLVRRALSDWGIDHEIIDIDPEFADTAQFCERYGYPLDRSGNTILVASKAKPPKPPGYCACVVVASARLDVNGRVRKLMGVRRASFASAQQTVDVTGMMIGGVTPFGLPEGVAIYVDQAIADLDYIILGSGSRSSKVKMAGGEFAKIPGAEFIEGLSMPPRTG